MNTKLSDIKTNGGFRVLKGGLLILLRQGVAVCIMGCYAFIGLEWLSRQYSIPLYNPEANGQIFIFIVSVALATYFATNTLFLMVKTAFPDWK
jgi:hypothetical protein